jgi:hypothetical protein
MGLKAIYRWPRTSKATPGHRIYPYLLKGMKITRQWSGISHEMFTAADTFHIEYTDNSLSESVRWLILGAAFAIELDFFENRGKGSRVCVGGFGRW